MIARRVVVHGVVQGVGFRWSMASTARQHGVVGWVRNQADGSVLAHLEGAPESVEAVISWAWNGPRHARVSHVDTSDAQPTGAVVFDIAP